MFLPALFAGAFLTAAVAVSAEWRDEGRNAVATAQSRAIPGADYPIVRARATLPGSAAGLAAALRDPAACSQWLNDCVEERVYPAGAANRTLVHRLTGHGFTRRVTVAHATWWRLPGGGAVLDVTGADDEATAFGGTRVLCLRERMTLTPAPGGRVRIVHEAVRDPQPPFGIGSAVVTPHTVQIMLEILANFADLLQRPAYRNPPPLDDLPELRSPLPDLGAGFARCQAARR
ncbi:MAG: hypothetical protein OXH96_20415 [Spirochaetaceae bacterium]|nr:hypothetical protein [Spirochaetaceae bacterium]